MAALLKMLTAFPTFSKEILSKAAPDIMEYGIMAMEKNINATLRTTDKTTGELAKSIQGNIELKIGMEQQSAIIEIGSLLPYAAFASRDIGQTVMNRVAFIPTSAGEHIGERGDIGNYRFIGTRPPIPGHPFLEMTRDDLYEYIEEVYAGKFDEVFIEIQRTVSAWSGTEDTFRSGMTGLFG